MKKYIYWVLGILFFLITIFLYNSIYFDIPRNTLEEEYVSDSFFISLDDNTKIHVKDQGNKNKPSIFVLHGFNSSLFDFEELNNQLSKDYRVISFDFPAFGLTGATTSKNYSIEYYLKVVESIKSYFDLDQIVLIGHSMGGHVSWRYAEERPEDVRGIVLLAPGGIGSEQDILDFKSQKNAPLAWKLANSSFGSQMLLYFTPKFFVREGLKDSIVNDSLVTDDWVNSFHDMVLLEGSREAIGEILRSIKNPFDDPLMLKNINSPVMLIHGTDDNLINVNVTNIYSKNISNLDLKIYENVGHWPAQENPDRALKDIKHFLSGLN